MFLILVDKEGENIERYFPFYIIKYLIFLFPKDIYYININLNKNKMDHNQLKDFLLRNNFKNVAIDIVDNFNNIEANKATLSEEEITDIENAFDLSKEMNFIFGKYFEEFQVTLFQKKDDSIDNKKIEFTIQVIFIPQNGNAIHNGFDITEEVFLTITEDIIIKIIGNLIFSSLATYGKFIGSKLLNLNKISDSVRKTAN